MARFACRAMSEAKSENLSEAMSKELGLMMLAVYTYRPQNGRCRSFCRSIPCRDGRYRSLPRTIEETKMK